MHRARPSRPTAPRSRRSRDLPTNGKLHPVQQAFHEHHALQCGYCTPGMVMAAVVADRERRGDRPRRDPRAGSRATSAAAPATTTSSRPSPRRPGARMSATETPSHRRRRSSARRTTRSSAAAGTFVDNIDLPGTVFMAVVRSPYAHARISVRSTRRPRGAEGVVAVFTGADLRDDWKAADAVRLAGHRGHEEPRALSRSPSSEVALPGRRRRGRGRRDRALTPRTRPSSSRSTTSRSRRSSTSRRRRRTARRSCTTSSARTSPTSGSSRRARVRRRRRRDRQAHATSSRG